MGLIVRPFGPEHCLYVASLSALRRQFRRSLPVRRAVNRSTDRDRRASLGRVVADGRDLCLAGHAVQRGSGVLPELLRGVRRSECPRRHVYRHHHDRSESGFPARERRREAVGSATGSAAARLGVRVARRHEQRERKPATTAYRWSCVPQMGEQEIVARQVEALGAGLYLAKQRSRRTGFDSRSIACSSDDRFREQAAVVRESFERQAAPRAAPMRSWPSRGAVPHILRMQQTRRQNVRRKTTQGPYRATGSRLLTGCGCGSIPCSR